MMGNDEATALANAFESLRVSVPLNVEKYMANAKIDLEGLECEEVEGDDD